MVVALDEFQEVTNFKEQSLEKIMRSHIQTHRHVSYIFAGSKRHVLYEMVTDRNRAFYNMGKIMTLDKIPEDLFIPYLSDKFQKTGTKIDRATLFLVLKRTDNIPHNVLMLCHELWEMCRDKKIVNDQDVDQAIQSLVTTRSSLYLTMWDSLSLHQRLVLKAITKEDTAKALTASDFVGRHNLGAITSIQRSIQRLIERDVLDKQESGMVFTDVFFKEWIRLKILR